MQASLAGKSALVTGGSRGIGREICFALANEGCAVAVNYASNEAKAKEVVDQVVGAGGKAIAVGFDVSDENQAADGMKEVLGAFGTLDILVNNAGIASDGLLLRTKAQDWQRTINVNLSSCFYLSKLAAKPMMKARAGRIINISSIIGETGNAGQVAYAASKAGIFGLTKSLARELGSRGITVNAVTPGYIETDMTSDFAEDQVENLLGRVPLGRLGSAKDIASAVVFLAGDNASYITGHTLAVNGGMDM